MNNPRSITHEQFKDAVKCLLLKKSDKSVVPDDYEPTPEELKEIFQVPSEQDETKR